MINLLIGIASITGTITIFIVTKKIYNRYPQPYTLPVLTSTVLIIILLLLFQIPYSTYMTGGHWLDELLGPVVVALAYPLYKQRDLLKQYVFPLLTGVLVGSIVGMCSGLLLTMWLGFKPTMIYSIISKSVTTPVSMDIAHSIGGSSTLAAVFVMIAGIGGAVIGPSILHYTKVTHTIAKGIGMGTASHAIGTARAMENSELEGAVSTVALTISAIVVAVLAPLIAILLM